MPSKFDRKVCFQINAGLAARVDGAARRARLSQAEFMRRAIERGCDPQQVMTFSDHKMPTDAEVAERLGWEQQETSHV